MLRVLNNTDDQVFVVQTAPEQQPLGLPPIGMTGGSPSVDVELTQRGTITCWLPLNSPATATVDLNAVPSRLVLTSTANKQEEFIVDLRLDDDGSTLLLGLFAAAPPPPASETATGLTAADKRALKDVGIAVGATLGTFLVGWGLLAVVTWATHKAKHHKAWKDLLRITRRA